MDDEHLSREVFKRRALWDTASKEYGKRSFVKEAWNEIALIFNTDPDAVKKRWKSLRDNYRVELKKLLNAGSTKWAMFESLDFLRDVMNGLFDPNINVYDQLEIEMDESTTPFPPLGLDFVDTNTLDAQIETPENYQQGFNGISTTAMEQNTKENYHQEVNSIQTIEKDAKGSNNREVNNVRSNKCELKKPKKRKSNPEFSAFLELEREKLHLVKEAKELANDPDYNFLISFLPHMKAMSELTKLKFRTELSRISMELRQEEILSAQKPSSSTSTTSEDKTEENLDEQILHTFEVYLKPD